MTHPQWTITIRVHRQKGDHPPYTQAFAVQVDPEEYVLDGIERIWAFQDHSLIFRHACHHSVCGACGMRVDGREKLTCITRIGDITHDGGTLLVEPMRSFPVVGDLVVDTGLLYERMEAVGARQVLGLAQAPHANGLHPASPLEPGERDILRLVDCIECGLCISACPIAATDPTYLGPAVLAAAQQEDLLARPGRGRQHPSLLDLVEAANGVWRCHSAYECTAVCPSNVDPAWRIMELRKKVVGQRFRNLFTSPA